MLPALVAAVSLGQLADLDAVQRTYLSPDGSGKAAVASPRMTLGSTKGGAVHMAPAGLVLALGEGVEEALTLQQELGIPTWATLGTAGLRAVELPPLPLASEVVIGANADDAGREAALAAVQRFRSEGRRTRLMFPPDGLNDFNDALRSERRYYPVLQK